MQLPALERKRRRSVGAKELAIRALEQLAKPSLVGDGEDDYARAFFGREAPVVLVVVVERDQRPPQLARQAVVPMSRARRRSSPGTKNTPTANRCA